MQDEPSFDQTPPPDPGPAAAQDSTQGDRGSDAGVASGAEGDRGSDAGVASGAEGDRGSDAGVIGDSTVIGESNALDLVDQALEALDQDDLELAEELAEQLQDREPSDEG